MEKEAQVITYDPVDPERTFGIDVHQYSGVVDWQKAKAGGVKFALIKATSGVLVSKYFKENWAGAKAAGILRGSWHWLYKSSDISAGGQARFAADTLKDDPGELPLFVDFEWTSYAGRPSNPEASDLWGFVKPYQDITGRIPGIYTSIGYWGQYGSKNTIWQAYPLWVANYKVLQPAIPAPFLTWKFWQFSENVKGSDYGVDIYSERAIDADYFNGTVEELYDWATGENLPDNPPPPTPEPLPDYIVQVEVTYKSGKKEIVR